MAMRMNHCTTCKKHFFLTESRCPHCGTEAAGGPMARFVRQARMGGLLLFTALTTTACYGTPAMNQLPVKNPGTVIEVPKDKALPVKVGTAYLYITPISSAEESQGLALSTATIDGAKLTLRSADNRHVITLEVPSADTFKPGPGVRDAVDVSQMKSLSVMTAYAKDDGLIVPVNWSFPGQQPVTGVLQIAQVSETAISGTLLLNNNGESVQLYFNAAR
jgi:hypothetical protein